MMEFSGSGWPLTLIAPAPWAAAYLSWNLAFCWNEWGLLLSVHVFWCVAFMAAMSKLDTDKGTDIGSYFLFARVVTLGCQQLQMLYRPLWSPSLRRVGPH